MNAPYSPDGRGEQPVQPVMVPQYVVAAPQKRSLVLPVFFILLLLAFLGSMMLNFLLILAVGAAAGEKSETRIRDEYISHLRQSSHKIAIISIEGVITNGEGFFKRQMEQAEKDWKSGELKAIVLRVNSPGGTISGSDSMLHQLREFRDRTKLPLVVSMGSLAASGGYYVSMAVGDTEDSIFAEPTTWTGSIGVIIPHYNIAELMKKVGVEADEVTSHRLKGMGSITREMTDEEKKLFEELVKDGFIRFKEVVKSGRPEFRNNDEALDKIATGQIFTAEQAKQNGLVDQIGFLEKAVDRAIELANVSAEDVSVIRYKSEPTLADSLFGGQSNARTNVDLETLLDAASPRAYYLCTLLPALTTKEEN
jgi:protease-4